MAGRTWWFGAVAALALGLVGPSVAEETPEDAVEVDEGAATADAVFEFLVAEFAAQRGDTDGALSVYHRLARELKDPQIARRAVESAIRARAFGPALESATLLLELDPESTLAREIMAALLANEADLNKARDVLGGILEKTANRGPIVMQLSYLLGKFPDKAAVLETTREVTARYAIPESRYAVGVAALIAGKLDVAVAEAEAALKLKASWEPAAILKAQVLRKSAPAEVIPFYESFIAANPASQEVRMQLGRELAADRKLAEAREQLRDAKEWKETYELLSKAVAKYPDSFEILYDRAMAAERIDKLDVLEKDLRLVIKMKPDYAHAYNALGYTLAEKTNRLTEAKGLIEQAIKLSPEDPFIMDSLGWVHFRMGEMGEALKQLQTAYSTRPDPEIAAHLGEVLWSAGQRDEAQKIWRAALSENPNHETLLAVMQKHRP